MKQDGRKIVMVTAYDAATARMIDEAGVDMVLVGDSLGNVVQGQPNTLPVSIEDMIYHTRIVSRGVTNAHLSADMPFMSYQASKEDALRNASIAAVDELRNVRADVPRARSRRRDDRVVAVEHPDEPLR